VHCPPHACAVIANNTFAGSRASAVICQTDNAVIEGNTMANVSSAAISAGGYFAAFGESPFGSNITIRGNHIRRCGLAHRLAGGSGSWGGGGAIRVGGNSGSAANATGLHRNVSITGNVVSTGGAPWLRSGAGQPAVVAGGVTGLAMHGNAFCVPGAEAVAAVVSHCEDVAVAGNLCCANGTAPAIRPCPPIA